MIALGLTVEMKVKSLIKILLSLAMLLLVFQSVDFSELRATLLSIPPYSVVVIVAVYMLAQILSSVKWWLIARKSGIDVSYSVTLKSYFIGMFVNCFGLGMVGGDVTRGVLLSQGKPQKTPAIASVVADRVHGLAVLSLLGATAALALGNEHLTPAFYFLLILLVAGIICGWFIGPWLLLKVVSPNSRFRRKAEQLSHVFPKEPHFLLLITILSLVFHLVQIGLHSLMAGAFGLQIGLSTLLTVIPVVNILSSLPISWNGLGVREKAYSYFMAPAIISNEQAIAFGAIWLLSMTVSSAVGGIVAIMTRDFEVVSKLDDKMDETEECSLLENEKA